MNEYEVNLKKEIAVLRSALDNKSLKTLESRLRTLCTLESLRFWCANLKRARFEEDITEIEKSRSTLRYNLKLADEYGIPYSIQNQILKTIHD